MSPESSAEPPALPPPLPEAPAATRAPVIFHGTGREYFGVWIVNLFLSIVTLGIYIPWARVRTRKYFCRNTELAGHTFDYVADPKRLLIGYVIIGILFIAYVSLEVINPLLSLLALMVFGVVFPWLRYKSLRFFAHNTMFRGLRFRFTGSLKQAYVVYLVAPIAAMATMGLLAPWVVWLGRKYFFDHMTFGSLQSAFTGQISWYYRIAVGFVFGTIFAAFFLFLIMWALVGEGHPVLFIAGFLLFYAMLYAAIVIWQSLNLNYAWNHAQLTGPQGSIGFESRIDWRDYAGIQLANLVLIIMTLGLFIPFAKVRLYRYRVSQVEVLGAERLESAIAVASAEENAAGDVASELFDFELGL